RDTSTSWDQLTDDDVLLQTDVLIEALVDSGIGNHVGGLLEGRRRQPRLGSQRSLGNTHNLRTQLSWLLALCLHTSIDLRRLRKVNQSIWQQIGVTSIDNGTATQHLTDDDLDVLVVDGYPLGAVNSLNLVDEVLFHTTAAENLKHVVWVSSTAHQTQTGGDVVTVAQGALDHCVRVGFHRTTNLSQRSEEHTSELQSRFDLV